MKNKSIKAFSIFLVALLATFGLIYFLKDNVAEITFKDDEFDFEAYSLVNQSVFFDMVDDDKSDYEHLSIMLANDDGSEFNIEEELQSLYDQYGLEIENPTLIPVGEKIKLSYLADKDTKVSEKNIKQTLSFTPEIKIVDASDEELKEHYSVEVGKNFESILDINAFIKKFDLYHDEIPLDISHDIDIDTAGDYTVEIRNDDYEINKDIKVSIIEDIGDQMADLSQSDVLVNKQYHLGENDVPPLKHFPVNYSMDPEFQAQPEAVDAFLELVDTMKDETGMIVVVNSAYRSYQYQVGLFNTFANREGLEAANKFSAKAGESEHQTGLAIDVTKPGVFMDDFGTTEESVWVAENADRFGFIIRFPEGKDDITGYQYEPWHLRYLGQDLAKKVKDSGLTYDEYWVQNLR